MFFLVLVVGLNAILGAAFKVLPKCEVHPLGAIVVNYWVCVAVGSILVGTVPISGTTLLQPWAGPSFLLGFGFAAGFNLMAWCTKHHGMATTTLAGKLSLVIPAVFALLFFPEERFHWTRIAGMALAFPALYLSINAASSEAKTENLKKIGWGIVALFLLSGVLDTGMATLTHAYFKAATNTTAQLRSTVHIFASAAVTGTIVLLYQQQKGTAPRVQLPTLVGGILLGIPNYFSVYFLMRLLSEGSMQPSTAFPVVNIGIVTVAVLLAIFVFKEGGGARRWAGLALAVTAIFLLSYINIFGGK